MLSRWLGGCILTAAVLSPDAAPASAQERPAPSAPFGVQGFRYVQIATAGEATVHVNECEEPSCGPGAKVSYVLLPPGPHSLESYSREREALAREAEKDRSAGTIISREAPTVERLGPVTIYESRRLQADAEGNPQSVVSRSLCTDRRRIDLVSSSSIPRVAEGNARTFSSMIVIWLAIDSDKAGAGQK